MPLVDASKWGRITGRLSNQRISRERLRTALHGSVLQQLLAVEGLAATESRF